MSRLVLEDLSDDELAELTALAEEHDVQLLREGDRGEPITIAVLIGGALAVGAVMHEFERRRGGQVIDLRKDAPQPAYRDKGLQYGLVMIRSEDGTVRVEVHEPRGVLGQVLESINSVVGTLTGQEPVDLLTAVREAVGDRATVTRNQP
ncbi:hypothetical protein [Catellatospora sp. NPDC049609]|uniref:hypothetical protein n=1 Tax=Catellatospora sp. NPDC049609 TaxID=3155505 RepID=UPI00343732CC